MSEDRENYNVSTWKFVVALIAFLIVIVLATFFWMWRDAKPRRRPALLGAPEPAIVRTNLPVTQP